MLRFQLLGLFFLARLANNQVKFFLSLFLSLSLSRSLAHSDHSTEFTSFY